MFFTHSALRAFFTAYFLLNASVIAVRAQDAAISSSIPVSFDDYNCATSLSPAQIKHYGQVIGGVYREWSERVRVSGEGASILCVTMIAPQPQQLAVADAKALFVASSEVGVATAAASTPSDVFHKAVDSGTDVTTLPSPTDASTAAFAVDSGTAAPTSPQQLTGNYTHNDYAPLNLGIGPVQPAKPKATVKSSRVEKTQTVGTDDRALVSNTTAFPYALIGQLVVTWKDGTQSICTGVLVSANVVLTAGQCAHNRDHGGFAARANFAPGQSQSTALGAVTQPYGARDADYVETNNRWTLVSGSETIQTTDARSDYAAYYFVQPWTYTTTFMPVAYDDTLGGTINSSGYPTAVHSQSGINQAMWYGSGLETTRSVQTLRTFQVREYTIDVSPGDNGAPFWNYDGVTRSITGLVSYGSDDLAGGVWFGGENTSTVRSMVSWTPSQSPPVHTSSNLRVAGVFAATSTATDSYLRFYNPTSQDATVTVRIADATTGVYLATWTSPAVAANSSQQFAMRELEYYAVPRISPAGHTQYTLNISATIGVFFQHVIWNQQGASLTNLTGCGNGWANDVTRTNNVHSSIVHGYPSVIILHNLDVNAADATLGIYDAHTGSRIGGVKIASIPSDAGISFAVSDAEAAMNFHPSPTQDHLNIVLEGNFLGYMEHFVYNNGAGVITNISAKCYISP